ncbi:MAG: HAMP domain-containing histidine kinase [Firmicutes bacterium]|nr:HAMP domain-containing histidine kinase [Bacillota bacterium]
MNGVQNDDERSPGKVRIIIGLLVIFVILGVFFYAGYGTTLLVYKFLGRPPESLAHVLSALTGLMFFSVVVFLFNLIRHFGRDSRHFFISSIMMNALGQIAHGNFEVLINLNEIEPQHHQFANAINEMAQSLGTMETMRQDFISNVSHEIQSPLTSISGFASLLKKADLSNEQRLKYAKIIEAESKRLSSLSDNLLKLSSLDNNKIPLSKQDFRLDKQLEHIALTLEPQWSAKNLTLEADLIKLTLYGDEYLLSQVWMNLIHNAIKFTPKGGQIGVMMTSDAEMVTIKISDTGVGISPDDQIHLFERFYKADKSRDRALGGNGLGLSLVKKIVELHGGNVTVNSKIGEGAVFIVQLSMKDG